MASQKRHRSTPTADTRADIQPPAVRYAGWLGMAQGVALLLAALTLITRDLLNIEEELHPGISGWGTGLWFVLMGLAVAVCGWGLSRGHRWGRGVIVITQLLMLGVAYYLFTSGQLLFMVLIGLISLVGLALVFNPEAVKWQASGYGR